MSDLYLLSTRQMARIEPYFPLAHGVPRVDDRRVVSGIVYVIKHGLQWKFDSACEVAHTQTFFLSVPNLSPNGTRGIASHLLGARN